LTCEAPASHPRGPSGPVFLTLPARRRGRTVRTLPDGNLGYALVSGHGRSGTNWLLELLDLSPQTFRRSEPRGVETSPLRKLEHDRFVVRADQSGRCRSSSS